MIRAAVVLLCVMVTPVWALDFSLPITARQTVERNTSPDLYAAPIGPFQNGSVPTVVVEGAVQRGAWRIESPGLTPFQIMRPLRGQVEAAGYDVVLDCAAATCGGFDFRFATETLPGPNMYVNIRAYHVVTGVRTSQDIVTEVVTVWASASASSAHVQIIHAGGDAREAVEVTAKESLPLPVDRPAQGSLSAVLLERGHAVLDDLDFGTGSTQLGAGPFGSLQSLAGFLTDRPQMRIALVGHTDTVGGLNVNITISKQRAASVRARLIETYGIAPSRLDAEGVGYLSPRASNLGAEGREGNRRVEVVLLAPR